MVEITDIKEIQVSLIEAISNNNLQMVQAIFNNNENDDIQVALSQEGIGIGQKDTFLDFAIICLDAGVKAQGEIGKNVEIIKQIWEVANQETRDFVCCRAIDSFRGFNLYNMPDLKTVIEEMEEHKRVEDLDSDLQEAIESLDVDRVKAALENCGIDAARVLKRCVYWDDGSVDALLVYPLMIDYAGSLDKEKFEKIKKITKLLWDKSSPDVRNFWLENHMIGSLEVQQKQYAGEGWLKDFTKEVKDYKKDREIKLNEPVLKEIEEKERIAQNDREIAERLQNEGQNTFISSINSTDVAAAPEKNDTNFLSKHKGKIALGVVGLCAAGAVAAYMLAYPVVALALTVLAAVILMGAGIAKVLEDPSVEKTFTQQQKA